MDRMTDNSERLAEIMERIGPLRGYSFSIGGRTNGTGYRVSGQRSGLPNNPTCPTIYGPEAYFTSRDDAEMYANLVRDMAWLVAEYERLSQCVMNHI